jgi:hypothetical protein
MAIRLVAESIMVLLRLSCARLRHPQAMIVLLGPSEGLRRDTVVHHGKALPWARMLLSLLSSTARNHRQIMNRAIDAGTGI